MYRDVFPIMPLQRDAILGVLYTASIITDLEIGLGTVEGSYLLSEIGLHTSVSLSVRDVHITGVRHSMAGYAAALY